MPSEEEFTTDDFLEKIGWGKLQWRLLIIISLLLLSDGMEIITMALIWKELMVKWELSPIKLALLSAVQFAGMAIGTIVIGKLSDVYGRKKVIIIAAVGGAYYSIMSSYTPNYIFLLISRSMLGFFIANHFQSINLMIEYSPSAYRSSSNTCVIMMWSVGISVGILLGMFFLPLVGWRGFLAVSAIPQLFVVFGSFWLHESIRYLFVKRGKIACMKQIKLLALINGKEMPEGVLVTDERTVQVGRYLDLFNKNYFRTSICIMISIFISYVSYYGIIFIQPIMIDPSESKHTHLNCRASFSTDTQGYWSLTVPVIFECSCIFYLPFLWNRFGRKNTTSFFFISSAIIMSILLFYIENFLVMTLIFCIVRMFIFATTLVYTLYSAEVYPTRMRGVAFGATACANKVGSVLAPIIGQKLFLTAPNLAIGTFIGLLVIGSITINLSPKETANTPMNDTD